MSKKSGQDWLKIRNCLLRKRGCLGGRGMSGERPFFWRNLGVVAMAIFAVGVAIFGGNQLWQNARSSFADERCEEGEENCERSNNSVDNVNVEYGQLDTEVVDKRGLEFVGLPEMETSRAVVVELPFSEVVSSWSLLNLLVVMITLGGGGYVVREIVVENGRKRKRMKLEEDEEKDWWRCGRVWRYLAMLFCLAALILFLVSEDMSLPMTWVNELSGVMLIILGMEVVFLVFYWWEKNQKICKRRLFNSPKFGENEEGK